MKNSTDRKRLLAEILSETGDFRATSLEKALSQARRARAQRRMTLVIASVAIVSASVALLFSAHRTAGPAPLSSSVTAAAPAPEVRIINDEELLNLFPDRAVALVGPPSHRQLVFLDDVH